MTKILYAIIVLFHICYAMQCTETLVRGECRCLSGFCSGSGSCGCECTANCTRMDIRGEFQCVNQTSISPIIGTLLPQKCLTSSSKFYETDVECNSFGKGINCPLGCSIHNNYCDSNISAICKPYTGWSCPKGCFYDDKTKSCATNDPETVCSFIERNLLCPMNCNYNEKLNKCMSSNPNDICGLEQQLLCPMNCKLNIRGDMCVGVEKNAVCGQSLSPRCPYQCIFDTTSGICRSANNGFTICEPIETLNCSYGKFSVDIARFPSCDYNKYTEICTESKKKTIVVDGRDQIIYPFPLIAYPKRLKNKYANIKCQVSNEGQCEKQRTMKICCN